MSGWRPFAQGAVWYTSTCASHAASSAAHEGTGNGPIRRKAEMTMDPADDGRLLLERGANPNLPEEGIAPHGTRSIQRFTTAWASRFDLARAPAT